MATGVPTIQVNLTFFVFICLYVFLRVGLATQSEDIVERPLEVQCPNSQSRMDRFIQGISMLTASDPFAKRNEITPHTRLKTILTDKTSGLWLDLVRFNNPSDSQTRRPSLTKRSVYGHYFQGFRQQYPDLPTETYSPSLLTKRGEVKNLTNAGTVNSLHRPMVSGTSKKAYQPHQMPVYELVRSPRSTNADHGSEPYSPYLALPWACHQHRFWVDLGSHVFPRYVSDTRCLNSTCWYGHYHCKPHRIDIPVFVEHSGQCSDDRLPESVRHVFMLSSVQVSGTCVCGRD